MASLREIKDRIGSVKSTLKITSAMKLVASSKLRKAQKAIENLRPYEKALNEILADLLYSPQAGSALPRGESKDSPEFAESQIPSISFDPTTDVVPPLPCRGRHAPAEGEPTTTTENTSVFPVAIVTVSSNSSLCGAFNANVIKKTAEVVKALEEQGREVTVYSLGRRVADAMRKAGYPTEDYSQFISRPSYARAAEIAKEIVDRFDEVYLIYNHFVTTAKQVVVVETWISGERDFGVVEDSDDDRFIVEPGRKEVLETLMPQVTILKFYAAVLDSAAAEHAARTIAMQTASDNAQELLSDLTLEYNKGRQQKITAEILDLVGGISE